MRINLRNMVCSNCVNALRKALTELGYGVDDIGLGYAVIDADRLDDAQMKQISGKVQELGFEIITDPALQTIERVKLEILRHINSDEPCHMTLSHCIADATKQDYKTVSRLFSAIEGRTIEKFYVTAKIEKAKELLSYGDISLQEIAYRLGYSSVAFLSRQFKQDTGMTPSQYQKGQHDRRALNEI